MIVIDLEKLEVNGYNELERALTVTVLDEIITLASENLMINP